MTQVQKNEDEDTRLDSLKNNIAEIDQCEIRNKKNETSTDDQHCIKTAISAESIHSKINLYSD